MEAPMSASAPKATDVQGIPRRDFLRTSAALGLSATGWSQLAWELESAGAEVTRQEDLFVINLLGGFLNPNPPADGSRGFSGFDERSVTDAIDSGTRAVNVTVGGFSSDTADSFEPTMSAVGAWTARVLSLPNALLQVSNASDIERAREERKVGVIFGFQNAAVMGDDASRVRAFADLGVRIVQLTYNGANQLGHGAIVPENGGLTRFGHEVIEALEATDLLVDLSHSGEQTCLDALRVVSRPAAITHTGCRALTDMPRNKTDEELRLVANTGGIVGIYFAPFLASDYLAVARDVVHHVEHAIDVCGEDHVGIGTDGGTTQVDDMVAFRATTAPPLLRRMAAGIGVTEELSGVLPMIPDLQGPSQFRRLAAMLMERGHSAERVEKIMGLNALRVLREVWRG
jgi:membrane dipeptidase